MTRRNAEFERRKCGNPECGSTFMPTLHGQEGCTRGCDNKIKGIPPVTLRSFSADPGDVQRGLSGVVINRTWGCQKHGKFSR